MIYSDLIRPIANGVAGLEAIRTEEFASTLLCGAATSFSLPVLGIFACLQFYTKIIQLYVSSPGLSRNVYF